METRVMPVAGSIPLRTRAVLPLLRWKPGRGRFRWLPEDRFVREHVLASTASMVGITVALFLAPGVNGFVAGWTGSGGLDARRSLGVSLVAGALAALGLWLILGPLHMPILGLYPGVGAGGAVLLSVAGLLLGTALRGLLAWTWAHRPRRARVGGCS
jgi:hypothetical protein